MLLSEKKISEILTSSSYQNNFSKFKETFKVASELNTLNKKFNRLMLNNTKIMKTMQNLNLRYSKILANLNKKKISGIFHLLEEKIGQKMQIYDSPKLTKYPKTSPERSSPLENKESFSQHNCRIPSKFQRASDETTIHNKIDAFVVSNNLNFVSNARKLNNFVGIESMSEIKNSRKTTKSKEHSLLIRTKTNERVHTGIFQNKNEAKQACKFLQEFTKRNEERSMTLTDICKSSENRLLSSLRQDQN
jgi:hypothetical protein